MPQMSIRRLCMPSVDRTMPQQRAIDGNEKVIDALPLGCIVRMENVMNHRPFNPSQGNPREPIAARLDDEVAVIEKGAVDTSARRSRLIRWQRVCAWLARAGDRHLRRDWVPHL